MGRPWRSWAWVNMSQTMMIWIPASQYFKYKTQRHRCLTTRHTKPLQPFRICLSLPQESWQSVQGGRCRIFKLRRHHIKWTTGGTNASWRTCWETTGPAHPDEKFRSVQMGMTQALSQGHCKSTYAEHIRSLLARTSRAKASDNVSPK